VPYIQFNALGDLFAFLVACHTRQEALGRTRKREKYSRIHLGESNTYRIGFARGDQSMEDGKDGPFLYGGTIFPREEPPGEEIELNDLLRRLPLLERPAPPRTHALVLAVSRQQCKAARPMKLLHEAWRAVPKQDGAESRFSVRQNLDQESWAAVEIREVSSQFDFKCLQPFRDQGLLVFQQAWNEPSCFLYVEWGFAYPKPAEFAALYDDRAKVRNAEGKLEPVPQLLLVSAGKRAGTLRTAGNAALYHARWLRVSLPSHSLAEDLYDLTLPAKVEFAQVEAAQLEEKTRLKEELKAGDQRHTIGAIDDIERRIARCGSELEDLLTRKSRLTARRHNSWLPAYTFDQHEGEPLPAKLRLFLRRPLGELAQFRYLVIRVPTGRRHCIVGDVAIAWGAALAVPSDATWLCDARWREWTLPLFIRSDCALSVDIDEGNMAAKVRDLLLDYDELDLSSADTVILTGPGEKLPGLSFCPLTPVQTLDEAIGFFNEAIDCRRLATESFERAGLDLIGEQDGVITEQVRELDASLQERAEQLLRELEEGWTATRELAMGTLLRLRVTEAAMEIGEQACLDSAAGWAEFVNHVLELDRRVSAVKLEAAARWFADEKSRDARLEEKSRAQQDFKELLAKSKALHEAAHSRLKQERAEIEAGLKALDAARQAVVAEGEGVSLRAKELEVQNQRTQLELTRSQAALKKLEEEIEQAARLKLQLEQTKAEAERKTQELEQRRLALEQQRKEIETRRAEITSREQALAQLRSRKQQQEEDVQTALQPLRQHAGDALSFVRTHLEARNKRGHAELGRAQAALKKLDQELEQAARLRQQLDQTKTETERKTKDLEQRRGAMEQQRTEVARLEKDLAQLRSRTLHQEQDLQAALEPLRERAGDALTFVRTQLAPPKPTLAGRVGRWFGGGKNSRP
jgi:hypothetical protein